MCSYQEAAQGLVMDFQVTYNDQNQQKLNSFVFPSCSHSRELGVNSSPFFSALFSLCHPNCTNAQKECLEARVQHLHHLNSFSFKSSLVKSVTHMWV